MNKLLKEEIERFQLLSNYDNKKTLDENYNSSKVIEEQGLFSGFRDLFGLGAKEFAGFSKNALKEIEVLFKSIPAEMKKFGNDAAEIATKLKSGAFSKTELGELRVTVFKNTTNTKIQTEIADEIVKSKSYKDFFTSNKEKKVLDKLIQKGYSGEEAALLMNSYRKQGGKFLDNIYQSSKNLQKNRTRPKKERIYDDYFYSNNSQKRSASRTAWNIVKGIPVVTSAIWALLWGGVGIGVAYYIWKYLTKEKKTGYPDCLGTNIPIEDWKRIISEKRSHILNTDTGNDFIDDNGGGKFYQNGSFETENGKYKGGWKEDNKLGIVITLQNGDEHVMSCEGTQDWGDEEPVEPKEKTEKEQIISSWNGTYTECDEFPMEIGCKNDGVIGTIQICLGLPKDGKFSPKVLDALEKKGYGYTLSYDIYKRIQSECGMGETESGFASYI